MIFEHGPEHEGKDHGRRFVAKLFEEVSDHSKDEHEEDVHDAVGEGIGADQAEEDDEGHQERVGNFKHLNPESDQGKVQDEEHDISDIHACDDPPEEVRMLAEEQGAGVTPWMTRAPRSMAMTTLEGMPRVRRGIKAP